MSDRITEWLNESQRLADQATEGPWEADLDQRGETRGVWPTRPGVEQIIGAYVAADGFDSQGWTGGTDENLTFIAESRTRLPQAVTALRAVMELLDRWAPPDLHEPDEGCPDCEVQYQMRQAIADALGLEGDDDEL